MMEERTLKYIKKYENRNLSNVVIFLVMYAFGLYRKDFNIEIFSVTAVLFSFSGYFNLKNILFVENGQKYNWTFLELLLCVTFVILFILSFVL